MKLPRRRAAQRLLYLSLSAVAVGTLSITGFAVPAAAADLSGVISGTITSPASVPGTHRYEVQAWSVSDNNLNASEVVASTTTTVESGATGSYTLPPLGRYGYLIRVIERPLRSQVPSVGDEFWDNSDGIGSAEYVYAEDAGVTGIDFTPGAYSFSTARVEGADRYGTSVATTQSFEPGLPVLYIASGEKWADALSAGPAASFKNGALLLTDPNTLPPVVRDEIKRLAPERTVVVGSELTVSKAVYDQIDAVTGDVERIGGADRYDTSRKLIDDAFLPGWSLQVFLATGNNFPDALSAGAVAGRMREPVLLVDGVEDRLDDATIAALRRIGAEDAIIVGQEPSISAGIEKELVSSGLAYGTERFGGADRYATNRLINEAYPPFDLTGTTYLASGENFPDALSAVAVAASGGASITLSYPSCVPAGTQDSLKRQHLDNTKALGSELTLSRAATALTPC